MPADTRVIVGIHECFRKEFAALPLRVKAVPVDDGERAAVVGGHGLVMCDLLEAHDRAQADVVRPIVEQRAPESAAALAALEAENGAVAEAIPVVRDQVRTWQAEPTVRNRAAIHTTLIGFERLLLARLSTEEAQSLSLLADVLTPDDVDVLLAAGLASLPEADRSLSVGMILEDTTAEVGELVWQRLPEQVRADFDASGRASYADYRRRLSDR